MIVALALLCVDSMTLFKLRLDSMTDETALAFRCCVILWLHYKASNNRDISDLEHFIPSK